MKPKKQSPTHNLPLPAKLIERRIYIIRGQEVMFDNDLAELYQVPTKRLNEAVRRNNNRFPEDFMFRLNKTELENWQSQFVISNAHEAPALNRSQFATGSQKHRNPRYLPYAFTEHGIAMLSSVLHSVRAIQMNIFIIRTFIELRKTLAAHQELAKRLKKMEGIVKLHDDVLTILAQKFKNQPKSNAIGFKT